jgi:signal peptidase I
MEPTLSHGQLLLVRPLDRRDTIARGDIVVARDPRILDTDYIKRIIGLPGEYVRIGASGVLINEHSLYEPYLAEAEWPVDGSVSQWLLAEDEYLVLGDNRNDSRDSRRFGPLSRDHILGTAWLRYWPPSAWGRLPQVLPYL